MDLEQIRRALEDARPMRSGAAVVIPLIRGEKGLEILFEVRALTLEIQPGEVCLPGGHIEAGESPLEAAVREACEELLVDKSQLHLLGSLGAMEGPGGRPLHVFVAELKDYEGTFSTDEVARTFTLPLAWLAAHPPRIYRVMQEPRFPDDFPWDLVPGGRAYPWKGRAGDVPFYTGSDPLVWGATARVLERFMSVLGLREQA